MHSDENKTFKKKLYKKHKKKITSVELSVTVEKKLPENEKVN